MIKPREGSLFDILSRSPWWISLVIAAILFVIMRYFLPDLLAAATTLPFLIIAGVAGWRQWQQPSARKVAAGLERIRAMRWQEFSKLLGDTYRRAGYEVVACATPGADLELRKDGYTTLVSGKRWKVTQPGTGPLRELSDARQKIDARDCIFVTAGELTETARAFAIENKIRVLAGADLARLA